MDQSPRLFVHRLAPLEARPLAEHPRKLSAELERGISAGIYAAELLKDLDSFESGKATLLVPIEAGPLVALHSLFDVLALKNTPFDEVAPIYVLRSDKRNQTYPICSRASEWTKRLRKSIPFEVTYDGGNGDSLVNTSRAVRDLCSNDGVPESQQIALNVRFQEDRLGTISRQLTFDRLDFGYAFNSSEVTQGPSHQGFLGGLSDGDAAEYRRFSGRLISDLLESPKAGPSGALRSVELIRAAIIGAIAGSHRSRELKDEPVTRLEIYRRLNNVYRNLTPIASFGFGRDNDFTDMVLESLKRSHFVESLSKPGSVSATDETIRPGTRWIQQQFVVDPYLKFVDQEHFLYGKA